MESQSLGRSRATVNHIHDPGHALAIAAAGRDAIFLVLPLPIMVPKSSPPPGPGTQLSAATIEQLRTVIAERWRSLEESEAQLRHAVQTAAAEARARALQPEALLLQLRQIEADVFATPNAIRATDEDARRRFHSWLVTACLESYFGSEGASEG